MTECICLYCKETFHVKFPCRKRRFCSKKCASSGEYSPSWVGDKVGKVQVHTWMKKIMPRPDRCDKCGKRGKVDLANRSNEYKRDKNDWDWLCRKCHMESDGRLEKFLSHSNMHNKLPEKKCLQCGKTFQPWNSKSIYCSMSCRTTYVNLNLKDYSNYPSPNKKAKKTS